MRLQQAPLVIAVCVGIAACGGSPREEAEQLRETAGSWAATLSLATEEWARGAVPSHFVESTTTAAARELQRETRRVRSKGGASASAPGDHVLARVPLLEEAVRRGDRSAALDIVHALVSAVPPKSTPPLARPQ